MIDSKIRNELLSNITSAGEAKSLCELGYVYKKKDGKPLNKDNLILLHKTKNEDGLTCYISHKGEKFDCIDDFEDINEEVLV